MSQMKSKINERFPSIRRNSNVNGNNYCIIMAGGFGSRFWPICRDSSPKQFIDILGNGRSMLQTTFARFERVCPRENIIIVTHRQYVDRVREQIEGLLPYQVLGEHFANCTHRHEPHCAVKEAVETGAISTERYNNYLGIYDQIVNGE